MPQKPQKTFNFWPPPSKSLFSSLSDLCIFLCCDFLLALWGNCFFRLEINCGIKQTFCESMYVIWKSCQNRCHRQTQFCWLQVNTAKEMATGWQKEIGSSSSSIPTGPITPPRISNAKIYACLWSHLSACRFVELSICLPKSAMKTTCCCHVASVAVAFGFA